jgi:hypothetical protein
MFTAVTVTSTSVWDVILTFRIVCCFLIACYLFSLFFDCEDGDSAVLRNISQFPLHNTLPVYSRLN